jgi:hypothetical protein
MNVVNARKVDDQNRRAYIELAPIIRLIPWDGELKSQVLIISNVLVSFSGLSSDDADIFLESNERENFKFLSFYQRFFSSITA